MTRQRTPPAVKWAANELAVLKGELDVIDRELNALCRRRESVCARAQALSTVLGMVAPEVPQVYVPVVRAHKRFGGRGNLRSWLLQTLESVYPQALDTPTLLDGAQQAFGLTFESKGARARFRNNSLAKALRVAAAAGEVERVEAPNLLGRPGVWRWMPTKPGLSELMAEAKEQG